MATYGHVLIPLPNKVRSQYTTIELYLLLIVTTPEGKWISKDLWQGIAFEAMLIYPPKCMNFYIAGREEPIPLQIPQKSVKILNCLYGKWTIYSRKHAGFASICLDD